MVSESFGLKRRTVLLLLASALLFGSIPAADATAARFARHYYSGWNYHPARTYYYSYYYYKPYPTYDGYAHHYCVYQTASPRYVYYYNPVRRVYWGRYDVEAKGYSELAEKDRKENLKDIPESAFPEPAAMPAIPESKDGEKMLPIDVSTLPSAKEPTDAPAK